MAGEVIIDTSTNGGLWAGMNNEQYYGDDPSIKYNSLVPNANTVRNLRLLMNKGNIGNEPVIYYVNGQPVTTGTPVTQQVANNGFDFGQFFADNKLLIIGVLAVGAYLMMSSGGGLAESTVVKRYATRK